MRSLSLPRPYIATVSPFIISALQVLGASLLLAFCAQLAVYTPFSYIVFSAQTAAVMLIGATLGGKKGALSVLAYIAEGACGLPVFAQGHFGIATLFGLTGGYLIGFVAQAYIVGSYVERTKCFNTLKTWGVLLFSCAVQLCLGALWLANFIGAEKAIMMGITPFVIGETIKALGVAAYLKAGKA